MPVRFQRHRIKGWRKPNLEAKCVTRPGRWKNSFDWRVLGNAEAVRLFRAALFGDQEEARRVLGFNRQDVRKHLRGRDLGCYCAPDKPCHADVLLEVANAP